MSLGIKETFLPWLPFWRPGQVSSPLKTIGTSTFNSEPSSAHTNTIFKIFPVSSSLWIWKFSSSYSITWKCKKNKVELNTNKQVEISEWFTLTGRMDPDSRRTEDPEPARIWSLNLVEQKKGSSTDLRMEWICFCSVVSRCFRDGDRWTEFFSRIFWLKTTAGILPWALSLLEIRLPLHSLGIAWIVWYEAARDDENGHDSDLALENAANLRFLPAERHHLAMIGRRSQQWQPDG